MSNLTDAVDSYGYPSKKMRLCKEILINITINKEETFSFLCSPGGIREMVVGFLFTQNIISSIEDILMLGVCDDSSRVVVLTKDNNSRTKNDWRQIITSGCGGGILMTDLLEEALFKRKIAGECVVPTALQIKDLARQMIRKASGYKETGGMHSAAFACGDNQIKIIREDIGRHNAVDKVIGEALIQKFDMSKGILLTTGRISSEMAIKAALAGIPILATFSVPTDQAAEICWSAGITLIGRILKNNPLFYKENSDLLTLN